MQDVRIFISSPGDVSKEREIARRVMDRLAAEFRGRARLDPYFWEYQPMLAVKDFQGNIPSTSEFHIVICILWSRLGSRLNSTYQRDDGTTYESGTEYELETAKAANLLNRGVPELLVYRNVTVPILPLHPPKDYKEREAQYHKLTAFVDRWFREGENGPWIAAFNPYDNLASYEEMLENHLRSSIKTRLPEESAAHPLAHVQTWTEGSPFRGLEVFEFEHAPIFFGRTADIGAVINALQKQFNHGRAFVLVVGASGTGKSSLIRAGVIPMLINPGIIEGVALWRRAVMLPAQTLADPFLALANALTVKEALPELLEIGGLTLPALADELRDKPDVTVARIQTVLAHAAEWFRRDQAREFARIAEEFDDENRPTDAAMAREKGQSLALPDARLLVFVDQLEEVFTQGTQQEQTARATAFARTLKSLATCGKVAVIATLRSDFYAKFQSVPELVALAQGDGRCDLLKATPAELGQMIRLPALAAGLRFEQHPVTHQPLDEVIRDVAVEDAAILPLVEFALDELYKIRSGNLLTFTGYESIDGIGGALGKRAESVLTDLQDAGLEAFDRVMSSVITYTPGEEAAFTRSWAPLDSIAQDENALLFVKAFVDSRLFQSRADKTGKAVYSISHEALLSNWKPRLADWLETNRQFLRERADLRANTTRWIEHGKHSDYLFRGQALKSALELERQRAQWLDTDEKTYLQASRDHAWWQLILTIIRWSAFAVLFAAAISLAAWKLVDFQKKAQLQKLEDQLQAEKDVNAKAEQGERIVKLDPNYVPAWQARVAAGLKDPTYAKADAVVKEWLAVPNHPLDADIAQAELEGYKGHGDGALKALEPRMNEDQKQEVQAKILDVQVNDARRMFAEGKYLKAESQLQSVLQIKADDGEARLLLIRCQVGLNDWQTLEASLSDNIRALEAMPQDAETLNMVPELQRIHQFLGDING